MSFEKFILKERKKILLLIEVFGVLGLVILINKLGFKSDFPFEVAKADESTTSQAVTVSAMVYAWIDFEISTTSLAIQPPLVMADGSLNIGSTPDLNISLGTNAPLGWQIRIRGQNNGLYSSSNNYTIASVNGTSTLSTSTPAEKYGANAANTTSTVTIGSYYDYYGTDTVGEIKTSDNILASKSSRNEKVQVAKMQVKATATTLTPPGSDYNDTITLTAVGFLP